MTGPNKAGNSDKIPVKHKIMTFLISLHHQMSNAMRKLMVLFPIPDLVLVVTQMRISTIHTKLKSCFNLSFATTMLYN